MNEELNFYIVQSCKGLQQKVFFIKKKIFWDQSNELECSGNVYLWYLHVPFLGQNEIYILTLCPGSSSASAYASAVNFFFKDLLLRNYYT